MSRSTTSLIVRCTVVAMALGVSGAALAGDNSMSRLTGESYAYFNGLDYVPGGFDVAAAKSLQTTAEAPARPAEAKSQPTHAVMLAHRTPRGPAIMPPPIFDDNTGA